MKSAVVDVPDRELQVLVLVYDDDTVSVAFREQPYHSWGPPFTAAAVPSASDMIDALIAKLRERRVQALGDGDA